MFTIAQLDSIIEKAIISLDLKGEPQELYNPMEYLISIGGKRIRPKLTLISYNLFSDKIDNSILYPALGMEIFHGFTLIHDDIMDNADMRRNQLTVHKKWNQNIAILSGDVMSIKSYEYIAMAPEKSLKKVLTLFSTTAKEVCEGQQYDMNYEAAPFITMEDYMGMIALKTAALIAASAKLGAIIAEAPDKVANALYNYGFELGLAFQIKDDYLDTYGDPLTFGKKIGGDIVVGKKSWLLVEAIRRADNDERKELIALASSGSTGASGGNSEGEEGEEMTKLSDEEKIARVTELYNKLGLREAAEEEMERLRERALSHLKEADFNPQQLERLEYFAEELINRKN